MKKSKKLLLSSAILSLVVSLLFSCYGVFEKNIFPETPPSVDPNSVDDILSASGDSRIYENMSQDDREKAVETLTEEAKQMEESGSTGDDKYLEVTKAVGELEFINGGYTSDKQKEVNGELASALENKDNLDGEAGKELMESIVTTIFSEAETEEEVVKMLESFMEANSAYEKYGEALGEREDGSPDSISAGDVAFNAAIAYALDKVIEESGVGGINTVANAILNDNLEELDFGTIFSESESNLEDRPPVYNIFDDAGFNFFS